MIGSKGAVLSPYSLNNYGVHNIPKIISNLYKFKPMSKELKLKLGERKKIIDILNSGKFDKLDLLAKVLEDFKKVAITPEEWEKAELTKTNTFALTKEGQTRTETVVTKATADNKELVDYVEKKKSEGYEVELKPQEMWNWHDYDEFEKTMELDTEVCAFILNDIKDKESKKEITLSDGSLITLKAKL
jgi:hypothetical protein